MRPGHPTRRGALLLLLGLLYLMIGGSYALIDREPKTIEPYTFAMVLAPIEVWGALWALCGLVGVIGAFNRHLDRYGFVALTAFSSLWGILAFMSAATGHPLGLVAGAIWMSWAGVLLITSGMR